MNMKKRFVGMGLFVAACAIALAAQDGVMLKYAPKVGDTLKYKMTATMDVGGGTATVAADFTDKVTKADDTSYTVEQTQSNIQVSFNGQDMPGPDSTDTTTFKQNGEIVDIQTSDQQQQDPAAAWRVAELTNFIYPDKAVKVGDEWTYKVEADSKKGLVAAAASYKVDSTEKIGDHDTMKIKNSYKEDGATDAASSEGFVWVDTKDGSVVKSEQTWTNVPLGPMAASGKVTMTRAE
jgi:hypothetical protein